MTVWTESDTADRVGVATQRAPDWCAGVGIPDAECVVVTPGGDAVTVWAECDTADSGGVAGERFFDESARVGIPQSHGRVSAARDKAVAGRIEGRTGDFGILLDDLVGVAPGGDRQQLCALVGGRRDPRCGKDFLQRPGVSTGADPSEDGLPLSSES
ncbi:hypothetical protein MPSYJ_55470 [Mycolicibacterium psychrotolerans]|uniref:Uncharacterized protein n=1 Tax=Mycolicibacterium psychrotolerans TaxID=216929 RepID=A0A7I7MIX4_9MYCO|nr:hypothetical protein MPSYJ_55470 [Mycolicibacterium psychrotolerans]